MHARVRAYLRIMVRIVIAGIPGMRDALLERSIARRRNRNRILDGTRARYEIRFPNM